MLDIFISGFLLQPFYKAGWFHSHHITSSYYFVTSYIKQHPQRNSEKASADLIDFLKKQCHPSKDPMTISQKTYWENVDKISPGLSSTDASQTLWKACMKKDKDLLNILYQ